MAKHQIELVSYGDTPSDSPKKKIATFIVALMVVLVLFSASVYFIFMEKETEEPQINELEADISLSGFGYIGVAGPEFEIWQGESFTLYGNESKGNIVSYKWDLDGDVDSNGDGNYVNDNNKQGVSITHSYDRLGQYTIRLWVFDSVGNFDKTRATVHVSYREEGLQGQTSSPSNLIYDETILIPSNTETNSEVQQIKCNLTYSSGSIPANLLNLSIYDGHGDLVAEGTYTFSQTSAQNMIEWDIGDQWLAAYAPGSWTARITQVSPSALPRTIVFDLDLFVLY